MQNNARIINYGTYKDTDKEKTSATQKAKFSIKDFFSTCDQICRKPRIWSHLLKKSLMEKFIFCAVILE